MKLAVSYPSINLCSHCSRRSSCSMLYKLLHCSCSDPRGHSIGSTDDRIKEYPSFYEERITFDEIVAWAQSFDQLMKNRLGQKYFSEFLKSEFSDENILFWQACEELKREKNCEKVEEKARIIYEDFISILSPKEVSLDSRVRELVNINMARPTTTTFNEAQEQIYTLMQRDSYPRFLASPLYHTLLVSFGQCEEL